MEKVMVAMSGGVDSSAAAAILKENYKVTGVTLRLFTNEDIQLDRSKTCCSLEDVEDARRVANKLDIDFYVYNFGDRFKECVIDKFNNSYINGLTPNPCIDCNRFIKFDALLKRAELLEQDYIATGHYVRRRYDEKSGRYILLKGIDPSKDQSYVLYGMTQYQLAKTLFPIGELTKPQTRELAEKYVTKLKQLMAKHPGTIFYLLSYGPVGEEGMDPNNIPDCDAYNKALWIFIDYIREHSSMIYLDQGEYIERTGFRVYDGCHYDPETNRRAFAYVLAQSGQ